MTTYKYNKYDKNWNFIESVWAGNKLFNHTCDGDYQNQGTYFLKFMAYSPARMAKE